MLVFTVPSRLELTRIGDAHFHGYCYDTLRRSNRNACPACRKSFDDIPPKPIGEDSVPRVEDNWRGTKKRKRPSRAGLQGEEEDVEDDELEEEEGDEGEETVQAVGAGLVSFIQVAARPLS